MQKHTYETITTLSRYAPWADDEVFTAAYDRLAGFRDVIGYRTQPRNHPWLDRLDRWDGTGLARPVEAGAYTLVDRYRAFNLWQLAAETRKLGPGHIIEVGSWRGGMAALMARRLQLEGDASIVYACDTYDAKAGLVKCGPEDSYTNGQMMANYLPSVMDPKEAALAVGVDGRVVVLSGIFPDETGRFVDDRKFRLIHLDVDVYKSTKDALEFLWPRLLRGGVVVVDDYGFQDCPGVTTLLNEERRKSDRLIIYHLNGQGLIIKTS
jgi:O-methyltransferase